MQETPNAKVIAAAAAAAFLLLTPAVRADDAAVAEAAERRDRAAVERLIAEGADVDAAQVDGMTALLWAAYRDDLPLGALLLEAGADPRAANRYGVAPLSLAAANGNTLLLRRLLKAGADPDTALPGGETALMTAARTGRVEGVAALLEAGAEVDARERAGQTALMWAAAEGHAEVVGRLLRAGADFRTPLKSGFTPLLFAVREGRSGVVERLLAAGADLHRAMRPSRAGGKAPRTGTGALLLAVENGHFQLAIQLLEAGADPNDQRSGFAPLHAVTWVRKPNRGDGPDGDPPPRGSGKTTSLQFVRELVRRGADVNLRLERGSGGRGRVHTKGATPFLLACKTADVPLLRLLLELGADPLQPNIEGCTPLMAAAGVGTLAPDEEAGTEDEALAAVELLLRCGADVNAVDDNGETAMHGAAYKSFPRVAALLAKRGAKAEIWNRKNEYGWTPLLIAEGHRVGNFKPSFETIEAVHQLMRDAGLTPPPPTPRQKVKGYKKR